MSDNLSGRELLPGTILRDEYRVDRILSCEEHCVTYEGFDLNLEMKVKIKEMFPRAYCYRHADGGIRVYHDMPEKEEYFQRRKNAVLEKARTVARTGALSCVGEVLNAFRENGTVYVAIEFMEGETLRQHLKRVGHLSWTETSGLLLPLALDMHRMHRRGVGIGVVSPDNIIICGQPDAKARLEFDVSVVMKDLDGIWKTPICKYLPIEVWRKEFLHSNPRMDEYVFCAVMYTALTGKEPVDSMVRWGGVALASPSELGSDIPAECEAVLLKSMAIEAEERYKSLIDMLSAFDPDNKEYTADAFAREEDNFGICNVGYLYWPDDDFVRVDDDMDDEDDIDDIMGSLVGRTMPPQEIIRREKQRKAAREKAKTKFLYIALGILSVILVLWACFVIWYFNNVFMA